jgi:ABC-type cobalamin/Fe3+-siderophores transport system ATPase subunit
MRDAQTTIIIGRNGTGKSTFCEKILKKLKGKALVVTYNGAPKIWRPFPEAPLEDKGKMEKIKKGIRQVIAARYEVNARQNDTFKNIYNNFRNGTVIFDDCRGYITSNVDNDKYFRHLLLDFRHKMLDLFFVVHSPSDVPPRVWGFASTVFVGSTASFLKPSQASIDTESVHKIVAAQRSINQAFRKAKARNDNSHYGLFKMVQL